LLSKGFYGGMILAAIGRDPNDQMLPVALAVVEGETRESWTWFLELLINDLGGPQVSKKITFMSDQQKVFSINHFHYYMHFLFLYCYINDTVMMSAI
jgi:hypothetical protein